VVHRELEFLLAWPPKGSPGGTPNEGRYLQGFFDCVYQDTSGGWHLVDYKTNDVTAAKVPSVASQYEMQMLLYALALETALGAPPVEVALHFLKPGVEYSFQWNAVSRDRCIELVDQAMRALFAEATSP
jgi:ATP-dependent helicase/nuclease subunit A